ncbi:MAG: RsbRD N-terminal domain-containing protein [Deltaproteobacteria bacterium]|nr:RsbRD N-terminal domain-containing protein [Deltaproteobacteria bacterium]
MIELFTFLEKNKAEIVEDLMERIPATVPAYLKVPKPELRQSLEHLLEAFGDYLVTGEPDTLTSVLRYITKVRAQQSFKLSDVLRSLLLLPPVIRERLQNDFRDNDSEDARDQFNEAMAKFEETTYNAVCLFVDIFQEYLMNMLNEHQDYLKKTNQKFGVDLSKFILFKG